MSNHQSLNTKEHAELRIQTDHGVEWGDAVMACLIVPHEFRQVQGDYPILFRRNDDGNGFNALAMLGFENGENLYLDGNKWGASYIPLSMTIKPFLVGRPREEGGKPQVHIDMDHPRVSTGGEGTRLFDEDGGPTPFLERISDQLGALHAWFQETPAFFQALERYDLLEPFSLDVPLSNGTRQSLVGYHIINEDKFFALDVTALDELRQTGMLTPIFMALASLSQLSGLISRKDRKENLG